MLIITRYLFTIEWFCVDHNSYVFRMEWLYIDNSYVFVLDYYYVDNANAYNVFEESSLWFSIWRPALSGLALLKEFRLDLLFLSYRKNILKFWMAT